MAALRRLSPVGIGLALLLGTACAPSTEPRATLRWGGDAEGGAPFVEADPANPQVVRGFDVDVAALLGEGLHRTPTFQQVAWASLEASVARGDVAVGLSGIEDRAALHERFAVSLPYFEFREVLAVRPADSARFRTLDDLAGHRVGTLGSTLAYRLLLDAQQTRGVVPVSYDDDIHPYTDLVEGRVDAVLLDHIIAERARRRVQDRIVLQPTVVDRGHYVALFAASQGALRDSVNGILRARSADGSLERIYRQWGIWDEDQGRALAQLAAATDTGSRRAPATTRHEVRAYLPALLRAAGITLAISFAAMAIAMLLGAMIAAGRVYGGPLLRGLLLTYVEVMRGTPVLLQLFVLYYGLSDLVRLPAMAAAILGLGLNYAAYEAEVYRAALEGIAPAQLEAARTLGLTEWQVLRLVRAPQALRAALAPMTNDFVALLKDSSLVSVITVVELTKQTAIFAANAGGWLVPGLACAALYLLLSLPLARVARRLESRWSWQ